MHEHVARLLALRHQVEAMRLHLDAWIEAEGGEGLLEDAMPAEAAETVDGVCLHPRDDREPAGVSGKPRQYLCKACLSIVDPDAPVLEEEGGHNGA